MVKKYKWGALHDKVRAVAQALRDGQKPNAKAVAEKYNCTTNYAYYIIKEARTLTGLTKAPSSDGKQNKPPSNRKLRMQEQAQAQAQIINITMEEPEADMVNHPPHYTAGGIETIDFIQAKLTPEEFRGYLRGNILKYSSRAGLKGDADEDLGKLVWYANKLKTVS
jgi:transposase-like protein